MPKQTLSISKEKQGHQQQTNLLYILELWNGKGAHAWAFDAVVFLKFQNGQLSTKLTADGAGMA